MTISDKKVYELIEFNERSQEKIRNLTVKNEQLRAAAHEPNSKNGGIDKDTLRSLRFECKDIKSKLTKANDFSRKIQDELLLCQKKLQKRKETVTSLQGEKSKLLKQIERLNTRNKELEDKVYNLESKLDNATSQISYLKKELNKYKDSSIVLVEGTNESISEQCADRAIDKSTIQLQTTRIRKLEDELSQKSDEIASMRSINLESINVYREQISMLEKELQKYTDKNDTLFKELQKSESKIFELINKRDLIINQLPTELIKNGSDEPSGIMDFIQTGGGPEDIPTTPSILTPQDADTLISSPSDIIAIPDGMSDYEEVPPHRTLLFIIGAILLVIIIIYLIFSNKKPKPTESFTVSQPVKHSESRANYRPQHSNIRKFIIRR